jgi:hypothetical protein
VAAIPQHDVEQNHCGLRIRGLFDDALVAQTVVDHRVRAAAREQVVAEIDQRVMMAVP